MVKMVKHNFCFVKICLGLRYLLFKLCYKKKYVSNLQHLIEKNVYPLKYNTLFIKYESLL